MDIEALKNQFPKVQVQSGVQFVDEGGIMTSGGVASGIHMALHIVKKLLGQEVAETTARRMEYEMTF